ncbi:DUF805 domain-containing protein [Klenkia marina]|uniref:DUF805 domain-containing protein n=1 Tax=Klenkia marina TaxID=1960309 RepID=UPI001402841D|nr:DUF805 domain-containing protein [Klenkia marina]
MNWYLRRGRIGRRVFWLHYVLPIAVLGLLAFGVDLSFGSTNAADVLAGRATELEVGFFTNALGWLTLVPSLSAHACRLHDQGRSAWWLLLNLVPVFGQLALLGICGFVPGQPAANRYGPAPSGTPGQVGPPVTGPEQVEPWTPGPADRAPDYPPSDWR